MSVLHSLTRVSAENKQPKTSGNAGLSSGESETRVQAYQEIKDLFFLSIFY